LEHSKPNGHTANGGGVGAVLANELHCLGAKMNWRIVKIPFLEPEKTLSDGCLERTPKACGLA
jgi:hypothetical protein